MTKLVQKGKNVKKLNSPNVNQKIKFNKTNDKQHKMKKLNHKHKKPFEPRVKKLTEAIPVKHSKEVEIIRKNFVTKAEPAKTSSKLPGIQNFWSPEVKKEGVKRPVEDDEDKKDQKKQRLTGADRYQRYMDEEERIRKIEDELADPNLDPHTPDQFERALMKDRNSSFMWIKYMAFHLETAETEKARAVAKKAVGSINFREEGELLNVWMALLNLEIRYGTDDTYNEALREAVQRNDPFKVYTRTLNVLLEIEKSEEADKIIETLKKKFKPKPEMWLQVSEGYLKSKNEKMAKEMLPKSLLSLQEKDHVEYMVKFALMTSKYDLHDFSQTIFEKILTSYNKKLPIWFTYIDMMVKNGQIDISRSLFERILAIKFPMKKLKPVFQKYIEFETKHGEAANVGKIKRMARNMLEQIDSIE